MASAENVFNGPDWGNQFRTLAENLSTYYNTLGAKSKPYHDPSLPHFSGLPETSKRSVIQHLTAQWQVAQTHITSQGEADNNAKSLWSALKVYGLNPGGDLFGFLEQDDMIEVYTLDGIQIWRNCNVMEICSYTIEEVNCYDWEERYDRKETDNIVIRRAIGAMLDLNGKGYIRANIPYHIVEEKFSQERLRLNVSHGYFFPLLGQENQVTAFLVTSKVEVVSNLAHLPSPDVSQKLRLVRD